MSDGSTLHSSQDALPRTCLSRNEVKQRESEKERERETDIERERHIETDRQTDLGHHSSGEGAPLLWMFAMHILMGTKHYRVA